jgi:arylsulfatase A-like enzyme
MKTSLKNIKFFLLIFLMAFVCGKQLIAKEKPNIVLFYIDDWAWNGSPVPMNDDMKNSFMPILQMPNVDKLAAAGMKFTNAYGSPQCSPARACIQTGQSNPRNGLTVYLNSKELYYDNNKEYDGFPLVPNIADGELDNDAVTIAEVLKPLGYTSAHIGKWHMRGDPGKEGYEVHDGDTDNNPGNTIKDNLAKDEPTPTRLPKDLSDPKLMFSITEKAIGFMEDQVKKGNPFYLQISHYAMHAGRECLDKTRQKYVNHPQVQKWYKDNKKTPETVRRKEDPANWLAMGEDLDGRIGAVLEKAKELGIDENTYFIVVADNGYRHEELQLTPGYVQPLHSTKWWLWEGGVRVPMIVKGPGIEAGSVFKANVINYDFLPTFYDWAGGDPETLNYIDGVSLAKYMAGKKPSNAFLNRNLYFHYPHYRSSVPHSAIISGSSKMIHFYEFPEIPMLFDLSVDIGEVNNIAKDYPEKHEKLHKDLFNYLVQVGARFPKVNPDFDMDLYKQESKTNRERLKWGPFEGKRELDEDEKIN